jgi:hypothetical protein
VLVLFPELVELPVVLPCPVLLAAAVEEAAGACAGSTFTNCAKTDTPASLTTELVATELVALPAAWLELEPAEAAVAPVAAIRASRSCAVVQVTLVPGLLTSGKAAQLVTFAVSVGVAGSFVEKKTYTRPELHGGKTENLPFTHCAKAPLTQASSPAEQDESGVSVANLALGNNIRPGV